MHIVCTQLSVLIKLTTYNDYTSLYIFDNIEFIDMIDQCV